MPDQLGRLTAALQDRYLLERELGAGGMATVYLAHDPRHQRHVALKVLRPDLAATLGPERFLREVTIAANLQHPHILPVYDSGEADGFLFYVMPYVEGESLREQLAQHGELPVSSAVRILRDVADAMAAAHAKGVVHRDIKPENIMLSGRHALVADFGVAKAVSEATGRTTLTTAGVALGTPSYMAPEQAAADPHTDHRADLYAFGVTAYEMLTGQPPFVGATPQAVLAAHMTEPPIDVTQRRTTIPPALAQLVMRCLEKKPADRPQSADELIPLLESVLTPSGGITPAETQPVRVPPVSRLTSRPVVGGVVAVAAIAVLTVFGLQWFGGSSATGGTVAVFPFDTRSADSADVWLAEGLSEQIGSRLARQQQVRVLSTNAIASALRQTPDPLQAGQALNAKWVVTGTLRRLDAAIQARVEVALAESGVQVWSSSFRRSDGNFATLEREVAESVLVALGGEQAPVVSLPTAKGGSVDPESYRLFLIGNALLNRRTPETSVQAAQSYEEAVRRDPDFAPGWAALGNARVIQVSWRWWEVDVPRDSLPDRARVATETALELDPDNAVATAAMGQIAAWIDGDVEAARRHYARAVQLDSADARMWHHYGGFLGSQFAAVDLEGAEPLLRRALALDPDQPNTWRHLATTVAWLGRLPEAEAILDTLIGLGPWVPAHLDRAYVRFLRGDGQGALADVETAAALGPLPDDDSGYRVALYSIATGDRGPALSWLAQPDHSLPNVAGMNAALGRTDAALDALEAVELDYRKWRTLHDPIFASLRRDPRFIQLLAASRLPGVRSPRTFDTP